MIRHFFIDKTNTIIKHSEQNMGLNPILNVAYGERSMMGLIHFDTDEIKELIGNKTFADLDKLTFTLKMTNCFSLDEITMNKPLVRGINSKAIRASSFDLMLYKLPMHFDAGLGFDYINEFWEHDDKSFTKNGSNWYCCKTGLMWNGELKPISLKEIQGGIYDKEFINDEYEKYKNGEESIIVGTQHFEYGYENLSIDITKYILDVINDMHDINYGLCLSFTPRFDNLESEIMYCVSFFNDNTNTFYHPYIEAEYKEYINDERDSIVYGKENKLYLYVSDNGNNINLDKIPTCTINDEIVDVKHASNGVYYAVFNPLKLNLEEDTIYYDKWSEIVLNEEKIDDVEMEFYVNPRSKKLLIGNNSNTKKTIVPSIYGINNDEVINRGDIREVHVDFVKQYESNKKEIVDNCEYRLYVKDGDREIDIINYQPIERAFLNNFFILHTEDLIPNKYYVDIKIKYGRETAFYKNILRFKIVNNVTNMHK
jgi:hypothetical protein